MEFETMIPDVIKIVSVEDRSRKIFNFTFPKFHKEVHYSYFLNKDLPHEEFMSTFTTAVRICSIWRAEELKFVKAANLAEPEFLKFLDELAISKILTVGGIQEFNRFKTTETSDIIGRFSELLTKLAYATSPKGFETLRSRCVFTIINSNPEYYRERLISEKVVVKTKDGEKVRFVASIACPFLKELIDSKPWFWGIALFPLFDTLKEMKS